jgi:hypothetical protein
VMPMHRAHDANPREQRLAVAFDNEHQPP